MPHSRIVFPLDFASTGEAKSFAACISKDVGVLKIGLELFIAGGPAIVAVGQEHDLPVFLDLKLHDIPETVERSVAAAAALGVRYLTVHASGGRAMMERAVQRAERERAGGQTPLSILAVTVLTSLDDNDLRELGVVQHIRDHVLLLAKQAWSCGVRGFVCSPSEIALLRRELGPEALLVVPGIRPAGSRVGDQKRVATPASAITDGADLLVIGRPIRDAIDPIASARAIAAEISSACSLPQTHGA